MANAVIFRFGGITGRRNPASTSKNNQLPLQRSEDFKIGHGVSNLGAARVKESSKIERGKREER